MIGTPWEQVRDRGHIALVLVRHGRTAWNVQGLFLGRTDLSLDDVGRSQADALAAAVRGMDAIYTSPLARARETAEALAPPSATVLHGLEEVDQGDLEGLDRETALARFPEFFAAWGRDPGAAPIPGGEGLVDGRDRALAALERALRDHEPGQAVAAVTHQLVIASITCTLAGEPLGRWRRFGLPNTGITVLAWDGSALRLEAVGWSVSGPGFGGSLV